MYMYINRVCSNSQNAGSLSKTLETTTNSHLQTQIYTAIHPCTLACVYVYNCRLATRSSHLNKRKKIFAKTLLHH